MAPGMQDMVSMWLAMLAGAGCAVPAVAQEEASVTNAAPGAIATVAEAGGTVEPTVPEDARSDRAGPSPHYPILPIGAKQAIERGYHIQRALGGSAMFIHNVQNMKSDSLAVAFAKGQNPPEDATLTPVPFVTTTELESHTTNSEFKADVWLFPFLNLFAGIGKVKGHINIGVDIDLDAFIPPPFCRPAKPCGHVDLPFTGHVDNVATTLGGILGYGNNDWFVALSVAKTLSVSNKDRSNLRTTDMALRAGPRFALGRETILSPYVGANYFDMHATVAGTVQSGPVFDDGDSINLRYSVDLKSSHPWAGIAGFNLELSRHWGLQAEYNRGAQSDRVVLSATFRP
ncbi:outer membrane beta-barrel protein [Sphingobium sp. AP49]|uniref:outer membrane beta-barrel protein n=1 Tax=Sphingobium sp. AP49 TaxID=1144307 RepID=UPI001EE6645F|nr:outer membrane beta-barrel protein [Sphingobium sp. AP49]WHO40286.1 outer membrane beta-barrel protein [Sphingobium sp. AP49]